ncbi:MAG: TonB-dependent receptor [Acidobacteriota bacterium]|nr:TonB-dependent receptor [Acidobacteriota bacterium]
MEHTEKQSENIAKPQNARFIAREPCRFLRVWLGAAVLQCLGLPVLAQQNAPASIYDASLDELMNVRVTSASKKEQSISKVAAAIYVITQDEIQRSGATNIPDLLRLAPGLDVAQINAHSWAISSRGFNGHFANKLLVLIDGRSVYNLAYSGVFWDQQDVPLADIERIEVIRGPGATVWGANAVNGVVNIITKNSKETHGGLVEAGAGAQLAAEGLVQYGGTIGRAGHYRVFANSSDYRSNVDAQGADGGDPWHIFHGGFRSDWDLSRRDSLTVQGDIYSNTDQQTYHSFYSLSSLQVGQFEDTTASHGGNALVRWTRKFSPRSDLAVQMYFDRSDTLIYGGRVNLDTVDFDFQHHIAVGSRHDIVWGAGYRAIPGTLLPGYSFKFVPPSHTNILASGFVQDEISLGNSFWLTLGTKYEYNDYTGRAFQPSVRALWSPNRRHTVWGAVSGAFREPSREDVSIILNLGAFPGSPGTGGLPVLATLFGNPSIQAEKLTAYESGYRYEPDKRVSLDVATFFDQYHHLIAIDSSDPFLSVDPLPLHIVIPSTPENKLNGNTYGLEMSATINVSRRWKLSPVYSWLRMNLSQEAGSNDPNPQIIQGNGPEHQFQVRSYLNLSHHFDFDTSLAYVGALPDQHVTSYSRLDARLARKLGESVELSLVGQNLLDNQRLEFNANDASMSTWVKRSVYAKLSFRF